MKRLLPIEDATDDLTDALRHVALKRATANGHRLTKWGRVLQAPGVGSAYCMVCWKMVWVDPDQAKVGGGAIELLCKDKAN